MFFRKDVLKIRSKFTGKHPYLLQNTRMIKNLQYKKIQNTGIKKDGEINAQEQLR